MFRQMNKKKSSCVSCRIVTFLTSRKKIPTLGIAGLELGQGSEGARHDAPRASANVKSLFRRLSDVPISQLSLPQDAHDDNSRLQPLLLITNSPCALKSKYSSLIHSPPPVLYLVLLHHVCPHPSCKSLSQFSISPCRAGQCSSHGLGFVSYTL